MKPNRFVRFGIWLIDRNKSQEKWRYLAGDLLEELEAGRSMSWFCSQVFAAILIRARAPVFRCVLSFGFSAGWSLLYPLWRQAFAGEFHSIGRFTSLGWPCSSLAALIYAILPALSFVWLGFVAFTLTRGSIRSTSVREFTCALSFSSNTLLAISLIVLWQIRHPEPVITDMERSDFFLIDHLSRISIPLMLSLMSALLFSPKKPEGTNGRGLVTWTGRRALISRLAQSLGLALSFLLASSAQSLGQTDVLPTPAKPAVQHVQVAEGVSLEVLDWGGTGRPLVFLAGLGNTAHTFDKFAPLFTGRYHVYGITRRGFGTSSKPVPTIENYSADRLADDVLTILSALNLDRPVLVGHSLAGEELSSIASRHSERIGGLIYLESGYGYAFYDRAHGDPIFDFFRLSRLLNEYSTSSVSDPDHFMGNLSHAVSSFDNDLKEAEAQDPDVPLLHAPHGPANPIVTAINLGAKEFNRIPVPVLAIYACPHNFDFEKDLKLKASLVADDRFYCSRQADAFTAGVPAARVIRIPNTDHYVFRSNEEQVVREMKTFLAELSY